MTQTQKLLEEYKAKKAATIEQLAKINLRIKYYEDLREIELKSEQPKEDRPKKGMVYRGSKVED